MTQTRLKNLKGRPLPKVPSPLTLDLYDKAMRSTTDAIEAARRARLGGYTSAAIEAAGRTRLGGKVGLMNKLRRLARFV